MKILMLNYEYPPLGGGASPVTQDICQELSELGHNVDVVTMGFKNLPKHVKNEKVNVYRVNAFRRKKETSNVFEMFVYTLAGYFKCLNLFKKTKYDFIHAHFIIPTGIIAFLLKKKYGINYIITSHGSDTPGYNPDRFIFLHKLINPIWKLVIENAQYITTPSNRLKQLILKNIQLKNIIVIPNGIYITKDDSKKEKIILYAGRLFKRKGVQYLLRAVNNWQNWKVVIVGDGPYKNDLVKISQKNTNVKFKGWIPKRELIGLYKKSSIFVLPSTEESFGMVLIEAMMYSNAIITTKGTACEEVVGSAGLLVKKRSHKEIREALDILIKDKRILKNYQSKARKRVLNYSWKKVIKSYVSLYNKNINNARL